MTTIPASEIVKVTPNVLTAGGSALVLNGLILTSSTRVPAGQVQTFSTPAAVAQFFGGSSAEAAVAAIYFNGFDNSNVKPGSILFAQYPQGANPAYIRGGNVSGLTLAQLQAVSGSLNITVDGFPHAAGSLNLSAATSFTSAAGIMQTALNAAPPALASVTASIAASTATLTASIAGNVLTVTNVASGQLVQGAILSGGTVAAGTQVENQLSGTAGGVGTYAVSIAQVVPSGSISATYGTMTVTGVSSGTLSVNEALTGTGVTAGTQITQLGTGTGGTGTYFVTPSQTTASTTVTAQFAPVAVTYDSTSGGFVITSGGLNQGSTTIAFATGTVSATLALTSATGAVLSQGVNGQTAATFMNGVVNQTQNWATFMLVQDPDSGSGNGQKLAFANWTGTANDRYMFVCWDTDLSPTTSSNAVASLGQIVEGLELDGTMLVWGPDNTKAAFICGAVASIDFTETNGRTTLAFRSQEGLVADVIDVLTETNLLANNYNFYGAYATANETFVFLYNGSVSGRFEWADSYVDQIWLNNQFQLALMELLTQVKSIPYNAAGRALIEASVVDVINEALDFGAFRAGITLSSLQVGEVNSAAGANIATTLQTRGWYFQVKDATPQVRAARGSPPCTFWYLDGQSVQKINLTSIELQ